MLTYSIYTLIYHNSQGEIYKICVAVNALNIVRSTLSKKKNNNVFRAFFYLPTSSKCVSHMEINIIHSRSYAIQSNLSLRTYKFFHT